jgi:hypothetical protein
LFSPILSSGKTSSSSTKTTPIKRSSFSHVLLLVTHDRSGCKFLLYRNVLARSSSWILEKSCIFMQRLCSLRWRAICLVTSPSMQWQLECITTKYNNTCFQI